jgi:hypothetical protein
LSARKESSKGPKRKAIAIVRPQQHVREEEEEEENSAGKSTVKQVSIL